MILNQDIKYASNPLIELLLNDPKYFLRSFLVILKTKEISLSIRFWTGLLFKLIHRSLLKGLEVISKIESRILGMVKKK